MKSILATSLVAILALSTACGEKKVEEKTEEQGQAAKPDAGSTGDASGDKPAAPAQKLTDLYPPSIGVYPLSAPAPGRSLYFGVVPGGVEKFEMIWVYAVAAVPNFDNALELPNFATEAEFDAFMEKWTAEFKDRPEMIGALTKLQNEFSFKVDPLIFNEAPYTIPAAALEGQPNYVKITQKFYARRYTTKAAGNTTISSTSPALSYPVVVTSYTAAQIAAGKTRYEAANGAVGSCASCHTNAAGGGDAFLKHSSDYLAYAMDSEIVNLVMSAVYPDGTPMSNPNHKFTLTPTEQVDLIGYLRRMPVTIDKLQPPEPAAALRLRLR